MTPPAPAYVVARRVLLDALDALQPHIDAIVLVGAQAVYATTERTQLGVAPFTTDADLVLDPSRLSSEPDLGAAMTAAGFARMKNAAGVEEPGIWITARRVAGTLVDVPVDLIVPAAMSPVGRRSARLPGHSDGAVRKVAGLEAATLDHAPLDLRALEPGDDRCSTVNVAGPTALVIAKSFKLDERLRAQRRPDRVDDKDAGDIYRLLQATEPRAFIETALRLLEDPNLGGLCREGLGHFVRLFGAARTAGTSMAATHLRTAVPAERVAAVTASFVAPLRERIGA